MSILFGEDEEIWLFWETSPKDRGSLLDYLQKQDVGWDVDEALLAISYRLLQRGAVEEAVECVFLVVDEDQDWTQEHVELLCSISVDADPAVSHSLMDLASRLTETQQDSVVRVGCLNLLSKAYARNGRNDKAVQILTEYLASGEPDLRSDVDVLDYSSALEEAARFLAELGSREAAFRARWRIPSKAKRFLAIYRAGLSKSGVLEN